MKTVAYPFLKWAGGKTQLLERITALFPKGAEENGFTYIEPFVGSGAVLFHILSTFKNVRKAVINDINSDLINAFRVIAESPEKIVVALKVIEKSYRIAEKFDADKALFYYERRALFNARELSCVEHAALFIFLNRTCFNGLYRVNRKNEFNVPIGNYKNPKICDVENIFAVSERLKNVEILSGDFEDTLSHASGNSIFYFDPPYKPISNTSNFNSYSKNEFCDAEQIRLKDFCDKLDSLGHKWVLSNSSTADGFFQNLYAGYDIQNVVARRRINSNAQKRGELAELLITNIEKAGKYVRAV